MKPFATDEFTSASAAWHGQFRRAAVAVLALAGVLVGGAAHASMTTDEIKQTVNGKRIYLQTPLGGEFPLHYRTDGTVDGSGEAIGLGRMMRPKDSGRWWVSSNQLCQQWQTWYDGKQQCFVLERRSETMLYWKRDDGLEGEARIGD